MEFFSCEDIKVVSTTAKNNKYSNGEFDGSCFHLEGSSNITFHNSTFVHNSVKAINSLISSHISVDNSTFLENSSIKRGGAIFCENSDYLSFVNSTFSGNKAVISGGAILVKNPGLNITQQFLISDLEVIHNRCTYFPFI